MFSEKDSAKNKSWSRFLQSENTSILDQNSSLPTSQGFLTICVLDENGVAIPPGDPRYTSGTVVTSDVSFDEALSTITQTGDELKKVADVTNQLVLGATTGLGIGLAMGTPVGALIGLLVAGAGIFSLFADSGPSDLDIQMDAMEQIYGKINEVLSELRNLQQTTEQLYVNIVRDLGDATLDQLGNIVDRITTSYEDFIAASNSTIFGDNIGEMYRIQSSYRERFR